MKLPKVYEPAQYEADMYALWEKAEAFRPGKTGKSYSVVVPPPNANGNLHIGHALTLALQDIAVRYHRLKGDRALLLPGADHAGFETQAVYEKHLAKEGKSRFDFTREELYAGMWDFVAANRTNFESQFRRLGAGVDWSRFTFTLDEKIVQRAYATFKKMWDEKLIYRGERLVNYCTFHRTGFADIEVVYEEATTPLYYMKYGPFELATTRPETKFGDTAVAVHPDDERYKQHVDTVITVEGVNGPFEVQVIADEMVDPNFGTGVVKITPAHSFDDWDAGQRHNLAAKRVINHDGTMNHEAGRFAGMTIMEARAAVVDALKEQGLLLRVDEHYQNRIGHCYKCGTVIEPMLMEQWFVTMEPLAKRAVAALKSEEITFYPESKKDQLVSYLENLRDWNISRQIAWGIPIPAFQNVDDSDDWIYDERVTEEIIKVGGKTYRRDPDVFDTWFSSSSWPYATLDYPDGDDFKDFYPLSMMDTGGEILYPWVSRMIMLGLYVTGKVPFETVYIHGYVMAEDGAKMSKSLGNVINPVEEIDKYGSDALRMGIVASRVPAVNRGYDRRKVEDARNFANKLWNIARYIEDVIGDNAEPQEAEAKTDADHWIVARLDETAKTISTYVEGYRFSEAYDTLYHFVWDEFADWYIEASKSTVNKPLLAYCLEGILKLAHPFAPFLTETIWQTLAWAPDTVLATSSWPEVLEADRKRAAQFEEVKGIIIEARAVMKTIGVTKTTMLYNKAPAVASNAALIARLSRLESVREEATASGVKLTGTRHDVRLGISDTEAAAFAARLAAKRADEEKAIEQLESRLNNKGYVANAPKAVVEQTRQQLEDAKMRFSNILQEIKRFGG